MSCENSSKIMTSEDTKKAVSWQTFLVVLFGFFSFLKTQYSITVSNSGSFFTSSKSVKLQDFGKIRNMLLIYCMDITSTMISTDFDIEIHNNKVKKEFN